MRSTARIMTLLPLLACSTSIMRADAAPSVLPTAEEMHAAHAWIQERLPLRSRQSEIAGPPGALFSFVYNGGRSASLLPGWQHAASEHLIDADRTAETLTWMDPKTQLVVECRAVVYRSFPTVEWTVNFRNAGSADTPILSDIEGVDADLQPLGALAGSAGESVIVHHALGSFNNPADFQPISTTLAPRGTLRLAPRGGRSSNAVWPYFNVEFQNASGDAQRESGAIVAVGWPGQWAATLARAGAGVRLTAGQELTHLRLHPGESVRTPLTVVQFWRGGDWIRSQNIWRRWMTGYGMPHPGGKPVPPRVFGCSAGQTATADTATEENQQGFIREYLQRGIKIDGWWIDAGWYPEVSHEWSYSVGTWNPDPIRFPNGIRPVSDYAHARNLDMLLWFEPERVAQHTWLADHHPEWLLTGRADVAAGRPYPDETTGLAWIPEWRGLNLGDTSARKWLTNHVDNLLTTQKIDVYRQDFNFDPLLCWLASDTPDRQGITENHYVVGLLAYWDELRRRHPNLIIDGCADGGRRTDIEIMRRSVPFTRSDYMVDAAAQQSITYGIAFWIPYYGNGYNDVVSFQVFQRQTPQSTPNDDVYDARSDLLPALCMAISPDRSDVRFDLLRRLFAQRRAVVADMLHDYYPLSDYAAASDPSWIAWQFDWPEKGEGMVQAFRHAGNGQKTATYRLRGLDAESRYAVTDLDNPAKPTVLTGVALMQQGLPITLAQQPGAALITYLRLK